jgi:hypothetical protein
MKVQPATKTRMRIRYVFFSVLTGAFNLVPTVSLAQPVSSTAGASSAFGTVDFPEQQDSAAFGINDLGEIVGGFGIALPAQNLPNHGFLLKGTGFRKINFPGATQTGALGINRSGQNCRALSRLRQPAAWL